MLAPGNRTRILILAILLGLLGACASLSIAPPGPAAQTLLVLPVKVTNNAQIKKHGFYYIYEIVDIDNTELSYEVVIKLPLKADMLIVDSLPPGNYALRKFIFKPIGSGNFTYGNNIQHRNDRFRLEQGWITIFPKSLNVLRYNKTPGRGMSSTSRFAVEPLVIEHKVEILEKLKTLPNYELWKIDDSPPGSMNAALPATGTF